MSQVSSHCKERNTPSTSCSLSQCKWIASPFNAAKRYSESTNTIVANELGLSSNSRFSAAVSCGPIDISCSVMLKHIKSSAAATADKVSLTKTPRQTSLCDLSMLSSECYTVLPLRSTPSRNKLQPLIPYPLFFSQVNHESGCATTVFEHAIAL